MSFQVTAPAQPSAAIDRRPSFRVALFGVGPEYQRMFEIVNRHARHNPYRFSLAENRSASHFDIAMVDMTVVGGPEVAATLRNLLNGRPVIKVGHRSDPARCDDVRHQSFAAEVLGVLNSFVERYLRAQAGLVADRISLLTGSIDTKTGEPGASDSAGRRPRALIVDDSPTVRRQLAVALHQMGMDSEAVAGAPEALKVLETREYEIVFADVVMPELDGYQLTRQIKKNRALKGVPVVILTSRSSPFDLARGALAGCSSYLVKPVSLQSLRDTVKRQLRKATSLRPGTELIGV